MSNTVFNKSTFLENFQDMVEIIPDIIEKFLESYKAMLARIANSIQSQDTTEFEIASHTIKGVVSNFFAESSRLLAQELESLGHQKVFTGAIEIFKKLELEIQKLIILLNELKESLKG